VILGTCAFAYAPSLLSHQSADADRCERSGRCDGETIDEVTINEHLVNDDGKPAKIDVVTGLLSGSKGIVSG
jgi:hypothetical protein